MASSLGLERFERHHPIDFDRALSEIQTGRKCTHWMWYIFPQLTMLGRSSASKSYGINTVAEAEQYMRHLVLGRNYSLITSAVDGQLHRGVGLTALMGTPDDLKLISSVTLFGGVARNLRDIGRLKLADLCDAVLAKTTEQGFAHARQHVRFWNRTVRRTRRERNDSQGD